MHLTIRRRPLPNLAGLLLKGKTPQSAPGPWRNGWITPCCPVPRSRTEKPKRCPGSAFPCEGELAFREPEGTNAQYSADNTGWAAVLPEVNR